ncbi:unnamed protein product [Bemisia tabaci]|uniref:SET domain-containing protein n=1 Tax=Bemisia tabaci TaxID=7038 RepID=A0A9P0F4C0_BEMTA|nr:unnamed protein product [Bemisia tabaci]
MNSDYEIRITPSKGKALFALKTFNEGDIILEEEPVVSCQFLWNAAYKYLACDHCLRPLETAEENVRRLTNNLSISLPHMKCCETDKSSQTACLFCGVLYCSNQCQETAYSRYHRMVCHSADHPLARLCDLWKSIHYPPETANIMMIARIIALIEQAENKQAVVDVFSQFCQRSVNENEQLIIKLLGEEYMAVLEEIRQLLVEAFPSDLSKQWLSPEGFLSLLSLIATNGQGVGSTAFGQWVKNVSNIQVAPEEKASIDNLIQLSYAQMDEHVGCFLNNEGSALYSLESSINHSCVPNAEPCFLHNNFMITVKAVKNISPGEEICISYLDECVTSRRRYFRQKILKENYLFICRCEKCELEVNDPDESSDEDSEDESAMEDSDQESGFS